MQLAGKRILNTEYTSSLMLYCYLPYSAFRSAQLVNQLVFAFMEALCCEFFIIHPTTIHDMVLLFEFFLEQFFSPRVFVRTEKIRNAFIFLNRILPWKVEFSRSTISSVESYFPYYYSVNEESCALLKQQHLREFKIYL